MNPLDKEVLKFYKLLLGTKLELKELNLRIMGEGTRLTKEDVASLVNKVSKEEIDKAMSNVEDDKVPCLDGFNVKISKNYWGIIKEDLYAVVGDFFEGVESLFRSILPSP